MTAAISPPTVFFNGSCPVCRVEIEHYRRLERGEGALAFKDISRTGEGSGACGAGLEAMRRRLHVVDGDGQLLVGVDAFARIWQQLPRYRWLATLVRLPAVRHVAPALYEPVALVLYRLDRRRRRGAGEHVPVSS